MHNKYGYSSFSCKETKLLKQLDQDFTKMIDTYNVKEWFIPALIDGEVLKRCGYFSTLPNHLTKVGTIKRNHLVDLSNQNKSPSDDDFDNSANVYLTPAACLHFYPMLEQQPLKNEVITTLARVYRYEDGNFTHLERQWDFTVREFVAVGSVEYVKNFLADMEQKLFNYALSIFDKVFIEDANDHFFPTKQNRIKERFQLNNNLKHELIANYNERKLAIASFNYHAFHFSKEFNFDDDEKIVSGCVGCGLERWLRLLV